MIKDYRKIRDLLPQEQKTALIILSAIAVWDVF